VLKRIKSSALLTLQPGMTNVGFPITIYNSGLVESNIASYLNVGGWYFTNYALGYVMVVGV
jgi:hypothetical protein